MAFADLIETAPDEGFRTPDTCSLARRQLKMSAGLAVCLAVASAIALFSVNVGEPSVGVTASVPATHVMNDRG